MFPYIMHVKFLLGKIIKKDELMTSIVMGEPMISIVMTQDIKNSEILSAM